MKKNNETKATNNNEKKAFNTADIKFNSIDEIMKNKNVIGKNENVTQYPLQTGVTLTICDTDNDFDFGSINIFGVSINLSFRNTKNGMMACYPSYKKSNGDYVQLVTNYSKELNAIVKEVLEKHYGDND